jgi:hypothetical protein
LPAQRFWSIVTTALRAVAAPGIYSSKKQSFEIPCRAFYLPFSFNFNDRLKKIATRHEKTTKA